METEQCMEGILLYIETVVGIAMKPCLETFRVIDIDIDIPVKEVICITVLLMLLSPHSFYWCKRYRVNVSQIAPEVGGGKESVGLLSLDSVWCVPLSASTEPTQIYPLESLPQLNTARSMSQH